MQNTVESTVGVTIHAPVGVMSFNHVLLNPDGCWNPVYPARLTCTSAGNWKFYSEMYFTLQQTLASLQASLRKNGSTVVASKSYSSGQLPIGQPVWLAIASNAEACVSGDYIEIQFVFGGSGETIIAVPYIDPVDQSEWNSNLRAWKV